MAPKPNGFKIFMDEFRKREEARGRKFPRGLRDVQEDPQVSKDWQALSAEEKKIYNEKAKQSRKQPNLRKKTGVGENMDEVQRAKKKELEFINKMHHEIEDVIAEGMEMGVLQHRKFFFIHSNWYHTRTLENGNFDYIPAEFAIAEFSLELGVTNIYHEILKAEIHIGFTRETMETSQETHQLAWDLPTAEYRFDVMCDKMQKLLRPHRKNGKYPPLYTSKKNDPPVKSLLKKLSKSKRLPDETFTVYSLEILFSEFRNAVEDQNNFRTVMAEYELIKDTFSYVQGLDCDYHKTLDGTSQFCSMSTVKRWAFTICDTCCEKFDITMTAGIHYPKKVIILPEEEESLTNKLNQLAIQEKIAVKSMTGVSNEHRMKVSGRSEAEERKRRQDKTPITVVYFAEAKTKVVTVNPPAAPAQVPEPLPSTSENEEFMRPLRRPKTKSTIAAILGEKNVNSFNDTDFPNLDVSDGRGKCNGNIRERKPGRGRGIALS